jgi:hypothetical protein
LVSPVTREQFALNRGATQLETAEVNNLSRAVNA